MGKKTKILSCLVVIAILMSVVPWMVAAQDVSSHGIKESKHIQGDSTDEKFKSQAEPYLGSQARTNTIVAVGNSSFQTIIGDLDELVSKGKIPGYDNYTEANIDLLWDNLDQYKIMLIDEDCMFGWDNPGPDYNNPTPVLPIGVSFYNHKTELEEWIRNGGGLFSTDQNDISLDYTDANNTSWTWLPNELQVESNEFPSDYPDIGYGHYPYNLEIITDPWIFSTPNEINITKVKNI